MSIGETKVTLSAGALVKAVQTVIKQYAGMGTKLTLRQIYYRLVAAQIIENKHSQYQRLSKVLVDARMNGEIPFDAIEDRTRSVKQNYPDVSSPEAHFNLYYGYMKELDRYYSMPRWWGQKKLVMVLVEKQALESLFQSVCQRKQTDLVVCRGYPSVTLMKEVADRLEDMPDYVEEVELLYFGDFDPSGADIERVVEDYLGNQFGITFGFRRIAITRDQIDQYNIPPAPAKTSDARYEGFVAEHGVAWQVELDAIEPRALQEMIEQNIDKYWDQDAKLKRDEELERRKRRMKEWVKKAFNPDFIPPEESDEDEQDESEDGDDSEDGGAA